MHRRILSTLLLLVPVLLAPACGEDDPPPCDVNVATSCGPGQLCKADAEGAPVCVPGCLPDNPATCAAGQACEAVEGGEPLCFGAVVVRGKISNALDGAAIGGARIAARDEGGAVVGKVATSAADGSYELPLAATRKADGTPLSTVYTLRADAGGFLSFPGGVRPALPIDLATAAAPQSATASWFVESAATSVALIPRTDSTGLGTVRGKVVLDRPGGTLVAAGGSTGVADSTGEFAVFNVTAGAVEVRGFTAGVQLTPVTVQLAANAEATGVQLIADTAKPLGRVTGSLSRVNPGDGADTTSVVLVLEETFIESLEIGEVAPGLRATDVSSGYAIEGVPDGSYVALASLENDNLVRDPDTGIGGTELVHLTVTDGVVSVAAVNFKVTGSLAVRGPGAEGPEVLTAAPTFRWADDSSEDHYELRVFDALGNVVWEKLDVASPSGNRDLEIAYGGPALTPGMVYQFRAVSIKDGKPISRTEDLRGVFSLAE
jgi:hypothetical protein